VRRKELVKKLKKAGWEISEGAKHSLAKHKEKPGVKIPIPRHAEINEYTASQILKEAGLK